MGRARASALGPAATHLPGIEHLDLYAGYVKQVNSLVQELSEMRAERGETGKDFSLAEGTRRLAYEYDGMVLHELYLSNLKCPAEKARPGPIQWPS